ncbi:hypothetical protein KPH14_003725 [Odynerus spinipes]|uniref:Uncharacterized protein n=1 Tax=Odynerus spinipes TaxID=1348599 RepID=A0AAD9VUN2_9HYME|nr:hypothetical protein KPH14_003725 [Odynerus spinipes]
MVRPFLVKDEICESEISLSDTQNVEEFPLAENRLAMRVARSWRAHTRVEMGMMQLAWIKVGGRPSPPASPGRLAGVASPVSTTHRY